MIALGGLRPPDSMRPHRDCKVEDILDVLPTCKEIAKQKLRCYKRIEDGSSKINRIKAAMRRL